MASEARNYGTGTERALYVLAQGTCYFPKCQEPVVRFVEEVAATNAHIAHIRGANRDSARYDETMTDAERAAFDNLVLLCKPHHDLVDRIRPENYSVETITSWKRDREQGVAGSLRTLTDDHLIELLEGVMLDLRPQRLVTVELRGGLMTESVSGVVTGPLGGMDIIRQANPAFRSAPLIMVTLVRNVGALRASVEAVTIDYLLDGHPDTPVSMVGENRLPYLNPQLPAPLEVGASLKWLTPAESPQLIARGIANMGRRLSHVRASVSLGSGETVRSETLPAPAEWA